MLCPNCLQDVEFKRENSATGGSPVYLCQNQDCRQSVPALYVRDYHDYPPVVVNAIGFRGHGKSVYFASLFYTLRKQDLGRFWPRFHTLSLNEESLKTVDENVKYLQAGDLPHATAKNFPKPTLVRVHGVPYHQNCTWLCYDTAGECFERPTQLVQFAGFVKRARTILFFVSLPDLQDSPMEMHNLLNVYVAGMAELGGQTREQNLVVVYTKADEVVQMDQAVETYLRNGAVDGLAGLQPYKEELWLVSERLRGLTRSRLRANEFLNAADAHFANVQFCIASALGAKPAGKRLSTAVAPRRVLDPILWLMEPLQTDGPLPKQHMGSRWKWWRKNR